MEDAIQRKALISRDRLKQLSDTFRFDHIFAKINPIEPQQPQESIVFVITRSSLPPIPLSIYHYGIIAFRNYPHDLDSHLLLRNTKSHPQSVINMCELIQDGLIYSGTDPISKTTTYWYKVQDNDILSSYVAPYNADIHGSPENKINDDVARGYIILLTDAEMKTHNFNIVETLESCPSKGGKSSLLQIKKRKNITKKRRRVSRRKSRVSRRKH